MLYAVLQVLNHAASRNIINIEDPVEVVIEGINPVAIKLEIQFIFSIALRRFYAKTLSSSC